MTGHRFLVVSAAIAAGAGLVLLTDQAYHRAKGWLAVRLVARAWALHLDDGREHRPWPWADFHPVARIEVPLPAQPSATGAGAARSYRLRVWSLDRRGSPVSLDTSSATTRTSPMSHNSS